MPSHTENSDVQARYQQNSLKKKSYFNYSKESLQKCLAAVASGMPFRCASKQFGVPFSTIRKKFLGISPKNKKSGPGTVLPTSDEEKIVQWMKNMHRRGFAVTKNRLLDSVALYVKKKKLPNKFTNGRPRRHWLEGFQKRWPAMSLKTPQNLNVRRANVTEENIRRWFEEVEECLRSKNLLNIHPSRIFNCDESAFFLNPKGDRVFVPKKSRHAHTLVGNNDKECLTALLTGVIYLFLYFK